MQFCVVESNRGGPGGCGGNASYTAGQPISGNGGNGGSGGGIFNAANASEARLTGTLVRFNSVGPSGVPGTNGIPGLKGSRPNLFGNFTIVPGDTPRTDSIIFPDVSRY